MRPRALSALLLAGAVSLMASGAAEAAGRAALVIGMSTYLHTTPLPNPASDARDIAAVLKELGFETTLAIDLDQQALQASLRAFSERIAGADVALVYFAGHGLQVAGQNYLLPVDARLGGERDLDFAALRLDVLLRQLETDREEKLSIVLLDACRDNPLARSLARSAGTRSTGIASGLASVTVPAGSGTYIAYSTAPGSVARDGAGRNSPFATALMKHMRAPGKTLSGVMIEVRRDVKAATFGKQIPWEGSALMAEFYFRPPGSIITGSIGRSDEERLREERTRRLEEELRPRGRDPRR